MSHVEERDPHTMNIPMMMDVMREAAHSGKPISFRLCVKRYIQRTSLVTPDGKSAVKMIDGRRTAYSLQDVLDTLVSSIFNAGWYIGGVGARKSMGAVPPDCPLYRILIVQSKLRNDPIIMVRTSDYWIGDFDPKTGARRKAEHGQARLSNWIYPSTNLNVEHEKVERSDGG